MKKTESGKKEAGGRRRGSSIQESLQNFAGSAAKKMGDFAAWVSKKMKEIQSQFADLQASYNTAKTPKEQEAIIVKATTLAVSAFTDGVEQLGKRLTIEQRQSVDSQFRASIRTSIQKSGFKGLHEDLSKALKAIEEGVALDDILEDMSSGQSEPPPPIPSSIRVSSQPSTKARVAQQEQAPALPPRPPKASMTQQSAKAAPPAVPRYRPSINKPSVATAPVPPPRPASTKKAEETVDDKKKRILMASLGISADQYNEMQKLKTGVDVQGGKSLTEVEKRKSVEKKDDSKVSATALQEQFSKLKKSQPVQKKKDTKTTSGFNLDMLKKVKAPDDEDPNKGSPKGGGKPKHDSWG